MKQEAKKSIPNWGGCAKAGVENVEMCSVAVLIPTGGSPKPMFCASKDEMFDFVRYKEPKTKDGQLIYPRAIWLEGSLLPSNRLRLAQKAISVGAKYMLWLDDDMVFPPDTLNRLIAHDKDVVMANYVTKTIPALPVTSVERGKRCFTDVEKSTGLEKVTRGGLGVCLMKTSVFADLPKPWFDIRWNSDDDTHQGEDVSLFNAILRHKPNVGVFVDHDLSKLTYHCGDFYFGHEHVDPELDPWKTTPVSKEIVDA